MRLRAQAVATVAVALLIAGCRTGALPRSERPNLLLIVVDTLRADRLGVYGYGSATTPVLDSFSEGALLYENAIAPAPFTMPSMASMFTGHYPDRTGVINHARSFVFDTEIPTLAERLAKAGYDGAAVVANPWLANRDMRFDRGFKNFVTRITLHRSARLNASTVTEQALARLDIFEAGSGFLWVHYMDTHMPYEPPLRLAREFGNSTGTSAVIELFKRRDVAPQRVYFAHNLAKEAVDKTRLLYDATVREVDEQIGRLLEAVRARGLLEDTIIVITADHGEALGDHKLFFAHDFTLYDELMRVPLVVRIPGIAPARIAELVSLMDIVPSLCVWLRLDCRESFDGRVLPLVARAQDSAKPWPRIVFGAAAPARRQYSRNPYIHADGIDGRWTMARTANRKLIKIPLADGQQVTSNLWEAYDLEQDPTESRNLLAPGEFSGRADWPADLWKLRSSLSAWEAEMKRTRHVPVARRKTFDRQTRRRLEALGYLQ